MALPEYLTEQTEEAIRDRMLARVPTDVDKSEGSYIWDALAPAAYELFGSSLWAQEVLRRTFVSTTFGEYLDLRCEEHGLSRRPAVQATGEVKFTGLAGTLVPAGTRVATAADAVTNTKSEEFETVANATLNGAGETVAAVRAVEAGAGGNVATGTISLMVEPIAGVTGLTNLAGMTGGADVESDESLLDRFYVKVRSPGTSGNKSDYVQWALAVPGIGGAQVQPLWNGPGTVKVYVLNSDKRAPSAGKVTEVQNYIAPAAGLGEGRAPIGAVVTVTAAAEVAINVSVQLNLTAGATLSQVQQLISNGLRDYLKQIAFVDPVVRYTRIAAVLLDIPLIVDFSNLLINGSNGNVSLGLGQVAVLGTVNVS